MGYSVTITLCVCSARTRRNIRLGVTAVRARLKKIALLSKQTLFFSGSLFLASVGQIGTCMCLKRKEFSHRFISYWYGECERLVVPRKRTNCVN